VIYSDSEKHLDDCKRKREYKNQIESCNAYLGKLLGGTPFIILLYSRETDSKSKRKMKKLQKEKKIAKRGCSRTGSN
jgi:hypothetical protein